MAAFKLLWSYDNWNTHSSLTLPDEDARDRRMMRLSQIADCDVAFRIEDVAAVSAAAANGGAAADSSVATHRRAAEGGGAAAYSSSAA